MEKDNVISLNDILTNTDVQHIVNQAKPGSQLIGYNLTPTTNGMYGFLSEYFKLTLKVKDGNVSKSIHLFVKALPLANEAKALFIIEKKFFLKETFMYKLFEEMEVNEDKHPWCTKAYINKDNILVMPDLAVAGCKLHPLEKKFDKEHAMVTVSSVARFHAAFSNYITKKTREGSYDFLKEYNDIMEEKHYRESPWLGTGARLIHSFLKEFSSKWEKYPKNLLELLDKLFITECKAMKDYDDTLNVIVHKDLWAHNIFFDYEGDVPTNAIFIDYQCIRYAPPAFDIMTFLYLSTDRAFRDSHEREILDFYYAVYSESIDDQTKARLKDYNKEVFLNWCDKARAFGLIAASLICPFTMIHPIAAQKYFSSSEKFKTYFEVDRSYPVTSHAKENDFYKNRLLELFEELVDRYILVA